MRIPIANPASAPFFLTFIASALSGNLAPAQVAGPEALSKPLAAPFCAGGFNLGNGLKVTWLP